MRASFQQLDNGKWGVRLDNVGGGNPLGRAGETVVVRKRDGKSSEVTLGAMVTSWNAGRVALYTIARKSRGGGRKAAGYRPNSSYDLGYKRERTALRESIEEQGHKAREEYDLAKEALDNYSPADHEWFDGEVEIQEAFEARLRRRFETAEANLLALRNAYRAAAA